jgi:murein DD-endopeptidase MepM/ murein hydrolase activator NlpD
MKRVRAGVVLLACLAGCAAAPPVPEYTDGPLTRHGVLHTVLPGQTIWRIARAYGVSAQELAEVNDLPDPGRLPVGQPLWIPGASKVMDVPTGGEEKSRSPTSGVKTTGSSGTASREAAPAPEAEGGIAVQHTRFIWPVHGVVGSRFGVRGGTQHDGIDIDAPRGTPIVAADAGEVLYVGVQRGYGNLVLLRHSDDLITVYAHNDANRVQAGDHVKKGEQIAVVGQTGNATGPHLHFEVRQDRIPRNPLFFLP